MKIASWIFTVLAYVILIGMIIMILVVGNGSWASGVDNGVWVAVVFTAVFFCVPGFIGHLLIDKYKRANPDIGKDGLAVYILSFVPFIIPYIALLVLSLIVWLIDAVVYLFTSRHYVLQFVTWVWSLTFGTGKHRLATEETEETVYTVYENGLNRQLTFWGYANTTKSQNLQLTGPTPAYRDDVGNFWITTDGGQNFIPVNRGVDNDCSITKAD